MTGETLCSMSSKKSLLLKCQFYWTELKLNFRLQSKNPSVGGIISLLCRLLSVCRLLMFALSWLAFVVNYTFFFYWLKRPNVFRFSENKPRLFNIFYEITLELDTLEFTQINRLVTTFVSLNFYRTFFHSKKLAFIFKW